MCTSFVFFTSLLLPKKPHRVEFGMDLVLKLPPPPSLSPSNISRSRNRIHVTYAERHFRICPVVCLHVEESERKRLRSRRNASAGWHRLASHTARYGFGSFFTLTLLRFLVLCLALPLTYTGERQNKTTAGTRIPVNVRSAPLADKLCRSRLPPSPSLFCLSLPKDISHIASHFLSVHACSLFQALRRFHACLFLFRVASFGYTHMLEVRYDDAGWVKFTRPARELASVKQDRADVWRPEGRTLPSAACKWLFLGR